MILENEEEVTETPVSLTRRKLTTPRAAAMAGILFALLYGTALILIRSSIPANQAADSAWLETSSRTVSLALNLVPYAVTAIFMVVGAYRHIRQEPQAALEA